MVQGGPDGTVPGSTHANPSQRSTRPRYLSEAIAGPLSQAEGGGGALKYRYALLDANLLKCHEELIPELLEETKRAISQEGYVRQPLLVEDRHYIILDGHHRFRALVELGCKRIPIYLVNYNDEDIRVETWPTAQVDGVTKDDVVKAVLDGNLFPPKTTRHVAKEKPGNRPVMLEDLV